MGTAPKANRKQTTERLRLVIVLAVLLTLIGLIGALVADVQQRLAALERADSDNGQWVMMQAEVEVLRLQYGISATIAGRQTPEDVRRWFDVLYSRLTLLEQSPLYADFMNKRTNREKLAEMRAFVNRWTPVVDGPDAGLIAALPQMEEENLVLQRLARALSLDALLDFSQSTDETRNKVADTLVRLALTTGATLLLLGLLAAILGRLYNITRRQAEENRATGERLQIIIANSPDAIVVTNRGGWAVEFNPAAEAIFGLKREAVLGQQVVPMMFAPEDVPGYQAQISEAISAAVYRGPQRFELDARRQDGTLFPLEISIAVRDLTRGSLVVAFMRDVSARRASNIALEEALTKARAGEKAKAEFLAVMSHEMRTPLNGLLGSMDLMRDTNLDAGQQELMRVMAVSGDILLGHVNSVLDVSRSEAGEIRIAKAPFDLDRLIEDCIANQAGIARTGGNTIRHQPLTGPLGTVLGDAGRLRQILLNLIGNAVKFTRNGSITIETERLPARKHVGAEMVEFRVIDTGIGIAPEDHARVFEDFETVDSSYGRQTGGTGLGLGISRRLTRAMGGAIGLESEPGEGSVFWLRVPLPAAQPQLPAEDPRPLTGAVIQTQPPVKAEAPLSILVIEDNEINRFLLRRFLQDAHHRVVEAADGVDGVAAAAAERFDVIITDISMPRMDGLEATRQIRSGGGPSAQARIIALTAHALPEEMDRFRDAGMDACLTKPVARNTILNYLKSDAGSAGLESTPMKDAQIIDVTPLADLSAELGKPMVAQLVGRMIADGDATVKHLTSIEVPDGEVAKIAHQLAGSCATFGATVLREKLAAIEVAIKRGDEDEATLIIGQLSQIWQQTRTALEQHARALVA